MGTIKLSIPKKLARAIATSINAENFVETGTSNAETSIWASTVFTNVYTIEIDSKKADNISKRSELPKNIRVVNGNSKSELSKLIPELKGRSVFYLDTHSYSEDNVNVVESVVLDELNAISSAEKPVVFINDVRCFLGSQPDPRKKGWPTFDQIFTTCKKLFPDCYITITDGVIVCVPHELEELVSAYWANTFEQRIYEADPEPVKKPITTRAISKIKRTIKQNQRPKEETVAFNIKNSEWFENQCKLFYNAHKWLQEQNFKSIVDIGANVGQFGKKIRQYYPESHLYSFEPIPLVYKELVDNFVGDNNFTSFNVGLGDKEGKMEFFMNEFSDSSSMLKMGDLHKENFPFTKHEKKIFVDIKTLDNCIDINKIEKPYLVKLDVQGFEEQVINGGLEIIRNAEMIITEASYKELYEGQSLFDTLYEKIKGFGFQYIGNLDQMNSAFNGEPLQGDAIFQKIKK